MPLPDLRGLIDARMVGRPDGSLLEDALSRAGGIAPSSSAIQVQYGSTVFGTIAVDPLRDRAGAANLSAVEAPLVLRPGAGKFATGANVAGTGLYVSDITLARLQDFSMALVLDWDGPVPGRDVAAGDSFGAEYTVVAAGDARFGSGGTNFKLIIRALSPTSFVWIFYNGGSGVGGPTVQFPSTARDIPAGRYKIRIKRHPALSGATLSVFVNDEEVITAASFGGTDTSTQDEFNLGGYNDADPPPLGNPSRHWNGSIASCHVFDEIVLDAVLEGITADVGLDEPVLGALAMWDFEPLVAGGIARVYVDSVVSGAGGAWSLDLSASIIEVPSRAFAQRFGAGAATPLTAEITAMTSTTVSGRVVNAAGVGQVGETVWVAVLGT